MASDVQVYEPYSYHLPPLRPYLQELWRRRRFALHLAQTSLKARHVDSALGMLWLVINPLMLALVYYLLIAVLLGSKNSGPDYFAHLLSGLFAFYFTLTSISQGAKSVTSGGKLIMNIAFPKALLPLSSVMAALLTYIPMIAVYAVFHVATGQPVTLRLLLLPIVLLLHTIMNLGFAMFFATLTVYFRDTASFLPYFLRVWLYVSPVLWTLQDVPDRLRPIVAVNPLYAVLGAWHDLLDGVFPSPALWLGAVAWALAVFAVGAWFLLSREREFAVRI